MEQPLVSIVVVSYNHAKYIRENLDSIKAQTYPNIELIVADDASSDNSVKVYEQWLMENDYPAKKNFHAKNTGLSAMLNECMALVTGRFVKLISADDYLHKDYVTKTVLALETLGHKYGAVHTNTFSVDEHSNISEGVDFNLLNDISPEEFKDKLISTNLVSAPSVLMRSDVLRETGEYDETTIVEDYSRWLKISRKYFFHYIPDRLVYYRYHGNNISVVQANRMISESLQLQIQYDLEGVAAEGINTQIQKLYGNGFIFHDRKLLDLYNTYRHKNKLLSLLINYKIPFLIFRILNQIKS